MGSRSHRVDPELARGLRNFWYPILRSEDLQDKPCGIRRLGEDLVLWRDSQQRVHLFADYCAHRAAKLSLGRVVSDRLACWYHGLQYDGTGQCVFIPTEPDSEPDRRLRVTSYPVTEGGGLIWGYIGDVDRFPPPPLDIPEELTSPEWCGWIDTQTWDVNYLLVLDNVVDSMHTPFLHQGAGAVGDVANPSRVRVIPAEKSFRVQNEPLPGYERDEPFEGMTFHLPNWVRLDIPIPGPGGPMRVLAFATPIDESQCQPFFLRTRRVQGAEREQWCEQWARQFEQITRHIVWQDEVVVASQRGLESRLREHLLAQDRGVIQLRMVLNRELARQRAVGGKATTGRARRPARNGVSSKSI